MPTLQAEAARQQLAQLQELAHAAVTSLKEGTANAKQKSTAAANAAQAAAEAQKKARALETAGQLPGGAPVSLAAWQHLACPPPRSHELSQGLPFWAGGPLCGLSCKLQCLTIRA